MMQGPIILDIPSSLVVYSYKPTLPLNSPISSGLGNHTASSSRKYGHEVFMMPT